MSQSVRAWIHILLKYVALTLSLICTCFKDSLESVALAQLSEIHIQRKQEQLPTSRI